jgi:NHL repeat-containing protein
LRELEARYPESLAVVGVHSGKYITERETPRIRDASIRLDAIHPTLNDRQFRVWRAYAVRAWPTLVAIDPAGRVIGMHAGEFTAEALVPFVDRTLAEARSAGTLVEGAAHLAPDSPTIAPGELAFPGKIALDGRRLAVADSGHHRVLVGTLDESGLHLRVERVVGDGTAGYRDGDAPRFRHPQGLAFRGDLLYVADAGNHSVREISLTTGRTRTMAGTGHQLRTQRDLAAGALSSPWDLCVAGHQLHVAMAGIHRLWTIHLDSGSAAPSTGTGAEELHDGSHAQAALAQPMGICVAGGALAFADSESSAIRLADLDPAGGVRTIVGTGLFDFGDVDGVGDDARLQHPQGITAADDGQLLVCDSYNDSLRWVDPASRRVTTWVRGLHEPEGLALDARFVYVADTNAHRIAVVERSSGSIQPLVIER